MLHGQPLYLNGVEEHAVEGGGAERLLEVALAVQQPAGDGNKTPPAQCAQRGSVNLGAGIMNPRRSARSAAA
ncbi:MAG TPA: hypothetical protein VGG75_38030 [Trebonia sp.]